MLLPSLLAQSARPPEAIAMLHAGDAEEPAEVAHARRGRYVALMAALARRPAPPDDDLGAEAEVVRVARDNAAHPERSRELLGLYVVKIPNPRARLVVSPPPQAVHLDARYRYAWEYLFLLPGDREGAPGYAQSALEALAKIHHDDSLPLVVESFKRIDPAYGRDGSVASQIQEQMLPRIGDFVSQRGLDAVIECAEDMRSAQAGIPLDARTQMDQLVSGILQPESQPNRSAAWAEVIAAYRRKHDKAMNYARLKRYLSPSTRP